MKELSTHLSHFDHLTLLQDEWLVTNGLGGFASTSLSGTPTRKYHGLLVAALPTPLGRTVMLNYIEDALIIPDQGEIPLSFIRVHANDNLPIIPLKDFRIENGLPIWEYAYQEYIIEKKILLINRQNTVHITYTLIEGESLEIKWRPYINFRHSESPVNNSAIFENYSTNVFENRFEVISSGYPALRIIPLDHASFTSEAKTLENVYYENEAARGYEFLGNLISPGFFISKLIKNESVTFIASTENWKTISALTPKEAVNVEKFRRKNLLKAARPLSNTKFAAQMVLAADQFVITPSWREEDMIRLQAAGEEARSIIAGYPWFTDWGRDTMISLEGLTLCTNRYKISESILRTFAYYVNDGLIPNMFPDGEKKALYNTADATLWFFHAVDRYVQITNDTDILEIMIPIFSDIIKWHTHGTHFGIKVDSDGLLVQGQQDIQLTWMDAKVEDWVVTPRRGKAVEINSLWYNALRLFEEWTGKRGDLADACYESFNRRFWYEEGKYLYDVVDGFSNFNGHPKDDPALRPNQVLAISLKYPILKKEYWESVLLVITKELLTPYGLRTLNCDHKDFKATYNGDLRSRDAAYHQGTVWPWLIGPYIDAWLKVYPEKKDEAKALLKGLEDHVNNYCKGTIGEIFDACHPFTARGCFAQAWSVAEFLRCYKKLHE